MNKKNLIFGIVLYLVSTAISFVLFNGFARPAMTSTDSGLQATESTLLDIAPDSPKTEACPLNGQLYTQIEQAAWIKRRPLAIMIENSTDARPHSGLVKSDVIYEALAEGGVTRFMALFYCGSQANNVTVGPVRSVRTYFIDWASEYGGYPLLAHVGGANCSADPGGPCKTNKRAQAIEQLIAYGWRYAEGNDLDQFAIGAPTFLRKENRLFEVIGKNVATEHSVVTHTEELWLEAKERGWTNISPDKEDWTDAFTPWKFQDGAGEADRGDVTNITFDFWDGYKQYDVKWEYDRVNNLYKRSTGGEPHNDLETGQQLTAHNAVVLFTKETGPVDDLKHMLYETIGKGEALIFQNGQVIEGRWSKANRTARTLFTNDKGKEIQFVRGRIWISIVSNDTKVSY